MGEKTIEDLIEKERTIRSQISGSLAPLDALMSSSLTRPDLGPLGFSTGQLYFDRALGLLAALKVVDLSPLPLTTLSPLAQTVSEAMNKFEAILQFDPKAPTPNQESPFEARNRLLLDFATSTQRLYGIVSAVLAASSATDVERFRSQSADALKALERESERVLQLVRTDAKATQELSSSTLKEATRTLEETRLVAAKVGVSQYALHFSDEANGHRASSRGWLWATGIFAFLTGAVGVFGALYMAPRIATAPTGVAISFVVSKVIVFSLFYTASLWAGRMYKAQVHNYVVNKHRQNALSTFEAFVKATGDDQTKNAVLLQATQSIFAQQPTGFVSPEAEGGPSPQILEIIRGATSTKP